MTDHRGTSREWLVIEAGFAGHLAESAETIKLNGRDGRFSKSVDSRDVSFLAIYLAVC